MLSSIFFIYIKINKKGKSIAISDKEFKFTSGTPYEVFQRNVNGDTSMSPLLFPLPSWLQKTKTLRGQRCVGYFWLMWFPLSFFVIVVVFCVGVLSSGNIFHLGYYLLSSFGINELPEGRPKGNMNIFFSKHLLEKGNVTMQYYFFASICRIFIQTKKISEKMYEYIYIYIYIFTKCVSKVLTLKRLGTPSSGPTPRYITIISSDIFGVIFVNIQLCKKKKLFKSQNGKIFTDECWGMVKRPSLLSFKEKQMLFIFSIADLFVLIIISFYSSRAGAAVHSLFFVTFSGDSVFYKISVTIVGALQEYIYIYILCCSERLITPVVFLYENGTKNADLLNSLQNISFYFTLRFTYESSKIYLFFPKYNS
eukprot:gene2206-1373_t